jgi:hypothetical protein
MKTFLFFIILTFLNIKISAESMNVIKVNSSMTPNVDYVNIRYEQSEENKTLTNVFNFNKKVREVYVSFQFYFCLFNFCLFCL